MSNAVVSWAKSNPVAAGAAAVGVLVVVMLVSGGGGGEDETGASGGGGGLTAYYAAVANQSQAGAAIQMETIKQQGESNRAMMAANYAIEKDKIWAPISAQTVTSNYNLEKHRIDAERNLGIAALEHQHAMFDNYVNLQNSALAQQQNIAFKQANAAKQSFGSQLLGTIKDLGTTYLTAGKGGLKIPGLA